MSTTPRTVADLVARRLVAQGVTRLYGLCGGHVMPIWDAVARAGIDVVDVRHEASAVYMAHAESELTGRLAVALVTAGPGLTNAVTAIANASVSRSSVLVLSGRTPRPQAGGMGAMQDVPQAAIVAPVCRRTEQVSDVAHVLPRLDAAITAALGGAGGPTGPAYVDFPTDLLDLPVSDADASDRDLRQRRPAPVAPHGALVEEAAALVRGARRVLVVGGRSIRTAVPQLQAFLRRTGAVYLDSGESRGMVPPDEPASVPAVRGRVLREADLVVTLGRRLDFQFGYGSPVVFSSDAAFLRIGRWYEDTGENRRGDVEVVADVDLALQAILDAGAAPDDPDEQWSSEVRAGNRDRDATLRTRMADPTPGPDGRMHPLHLVGAINDHLGDDAVVVADGGDILSFARVGLRAVRYLDCGAFGCLGVGVPFGIAAALERPGATVVSLVGDGSVGFTAMEVDTAVRHGARVLFVVANNESWAIERRDQEDRFGGRLVGVDLPGCRYAEVARGLGAHAERVEDPAELPDAIARGLARAPALLDVAVTRDAVSPDYASGLAVVPPRQALRTWNDAEVARRAEG
jgi:acetolactate synthase I/II/III large subunit